MRPVRSSVVPAGTVMPLRVIVVQLVLPLMADAASVKVQLARSFSWPGTGLAAAKAPRERRRAEEIIVILRQFTEDRTQ